MKSKVLLILAVFLVASLCSTLQAEELNVEVMEFCAAVEDRAPVGATTQFLNPIEKIYCYTKITGAADTISVYHVWYYDEKEMARVELTVKSASWRTWSSKKMLQEWSDVWRVDVETEDGTVLASKEFIYKPLAE
jgi:hypothetical protein